MDTLQTLCEQLESWALVREKSLVAPDHTGARRARKLLAELRDLQREAKYDAAWRARVRALELKVKRLTSDAGRAVHDSTNRLHVSPDRRSTVKMKVVVPSSEEDQEPVLPILSEKKRQK